MSTDASRSTLKNLIGYYMLGSAAVGLVSWWLASREVSAPLAAVAMSLAALAVAATRAKKWLNLAQTSSSLSTPATVPRREGGYELWPRGASRSLLLVALVVVAVIVLLPVQQPDQTSTPSGLHLVDMFAQMGRVAWGVAAVLFIMSFWSVGIAVNRIYTYYQARKQSKLYAPQVARHLREGRLKEAIALSASRDYRYSHLAKVVLAGLQEYQFQQESGSSSNRDDVLDTVRRSIQRATALTASDLKKGVNTLATIGSVAPFVGLLGTVVGVFNAFVGIASTGSGIAGVSAGIAEALVETALGLFVAIPAVWFYNYLTSRIEYFNVEMDKSSSELVDFFNKRTAG